MSAEIAVRMVGADFLKLRKKRGTLIWSLVLTLAPVLIFFIVRAVQHSSSPAEHAPAGGVSGYTDALRILAVFFGPLAAIMIGTDGGAGDLAAGVFRDLVVTGRSRLALFATRVPAAVGLCWLVVTAGYALTLIGTYALASGTPTPDGSEVLNGYLFTLLSTGVVCIVAVGFSSLTGSRPSALTVLIGWQLVASRILESISSLGSSRKLILSQAIAHFSPVNLGDRGGRGGTVVTMGVGVAVLVLAAWLVIFLALGAWRTRTMDA
jgi:ABC-type transport system involved in multi-copper enzyme maturation permease subunit